MSTILLLNVLSFIYKRTLRLNSLRNCPLVDFCSVNAKRASISTLSHL